ncbi:hypothetical protein AAY473_008552 [Plecturocebus cupreus]
MGCELTPPSVPPTHTRPHCYMFGVFLLEQSLLPTPFPHPNPPTQKEPVDPPTPYNLKQSDSDTSKLWLQRTQRAAFGVRTLNWGGTPTGPRAHRSQKLPELPHTWTTAPCCLYINLPFARQLLRGCGLTPTNPDSGPQGGMQGAQSLQTLSSVNHCAVTSGQERRGSCTPGTQESPQRFIPDSGHLPHVEPEREAGASGPCPGAPRESCLVSQRAGALTEAACRHDSIRQSHFPILLCGGVHTGMHKLGNATACRGKGTERGESWTEVRERSFHDLGQQLSPHIHTENLLQVMLMQSGPEPEALELRILLRCGLGQAVCDRAQDGKFLTSSHVTHSRFSEPSDWVHHQKGELCVPSPSGCLAPVSTLLEKSHHLSGQPVAAVDNSESFLILTCPTVNLQSFSLDLASEAVFLSFILCLVLMADRVGAGEQISVQMGRAIWAMSPWWSSHGKRGLGLPKVKPSQRPKGSHSISCCHSLPPCKVTDDPALLVLLLWWTRKQFLYKVMASLIFYLPPAMLNPISAISRKLINISALTCQHEPANSGQSMEVLTR